jgi:hypothetical protein
MSGKTDVGRPWTRSGTEYVRDLRSVLVSVLIEEALVRVCKVSYLNGMGSSYEYRDMPRNLKTQSVGLFGFPRVIN